MLALLLAASAARAQITDPLPDPELGPVSGVRLVRFVQIPNSQVSNSAARLNMLREAPDGSGRLFVIDQRGYMWTILPGGELSLYMDVRTHLAGPTLFSSPDNAYGQTGLTSFAFHPDFENNGIFYTVTSTSTTSGAPDFVATRPINPGNGVRNPSHHDLIIEWTASNPAANIFAGTTREVLRVEQPYGDHNIGEITFNPKAQPGDADYGILYAALADGGNVFPIIIADPQDNGQNRSTILGAIIRIDPRGSDAANGKYGIPADNPFVDASDGTLPEIWTWGHRNPHRFAWDTGSSGALYNFEMGQWMIDEINRIEPGGNYGWDVREGSFRLDDTNEFVLWPLPGDEEPGTYVYPVAQYDHPGNQGQANSGSGAIAGGVVYRGSMLPELYGKIVFGDFTARNQMYYVDAADIAAAQPGESATIHQLRVYNEQGLPSTLSHIIRGVANQRTDIRFSSDLAGEIYITNKHNGWVYTVELAPSAASFEIEPAAVIINEAGGSVEFAVATDAAAPWGLDTEAGWLSPEAPSHTGSVTLEIGVEALPDGVDRRSAALVVAGTPLWVTQVRSGSAFELFPYAYELDTYIASWAGWMEIGLYPYAWHWPLEWVYVSDASTPDEHFWYSYLHEAWVFTSPSYFPWIYIYGEEGEWLPL